MKYLSPILVLILLSSVSAGQPKFKHLDISQGLSQNTINTMCQDSQGFLWIGTQDGLNRYDGYHFKIYRPEGNNPFSINAIDIWSIHQSDADSGNVLWIGTHAGGLNIYDIRADKFYHFLPDPDNPLSVSDKNILTVHSTTIDTTRIVIVGGQFHGMDILILKNNWIQEMRMGTLPWKEIYHFEHNPDDPESLSHNAINIFYEDTILQNKCVKTIWIGTYGGGLNRLDILQHDAGISYKINNSMVNSKQIHSGKDDNIKDIIIEKQSANRKIMWLGTHDGLKKLTLSLREDKHDAKVIKFEIFRHADNDPSSLLNNEIYSLLLDQTGTIWISSYHGLNRVRKSQTSNIRFESFIHQPDNISSISENHIVSLLEDDSGIIWAGTHGKGLNLYDRNAEKFRHYLNHPASEIRLNDNNIKSIFDDPDENILWIGTHNGGLNRVNLETNTTQYFTNQSVDVQSIGHNRIIKIYQDQHGILWLGTYNGGILKFDKKKYTSTQYMYQPRDETGISDDDVNSIIEEDEENLWLGTYGGGINKFNHITEKFIHYHHNPDDTKSISSDLVRAILKTKNNSIWVGSEGGLSRLIKSDNDKVSFKNYQHTMGDTTSLSTNHIFCIHEAVVHYTGQLWIGTEGGGINRFDPETGKFKSYTTQDGLPNDVVYSILEDETGNLWISTNFGLAKFNPQNEEFTNFTVKDGLQSNEFNFGAACRRKNGEMLFGGINGINSFYPENIVSSKYDAPVVLTNLEILNKPVNPGSDKLKDNITVAKEIVLNYSDNIFSFEFASLHLYSPGKNRYRYRMDGFDQNWTEIDATRRFVTYTNLDPGAYLFRVMGTNNDGVWNDDETRIHIRILPPYWQTWWFRLLAILLILSLLYLIHRYRLARLLEIERLRVRIASDLHDDLGSALTKIALHSEIIQSSDKSDQVKSSSKKIGGMSREIITTMSDVVWSIDARNDNMGNLIDRMRDFAYSVLSLQDIAVSFKTHSLDPDKKIPINYRQNIFLIFKESINNIARHAGATAVTVELRNDRQNFSMRVSDNGHGFEKKSVKSGNGLGNMEMRAKRIGAEISVKSDGGVNILLTMKKIK